MTTKTIKTTIFGLLVVTALTTTPFEMYEAFAWHDSGQKVMTPSDRDWNCTNFGSVDVRLVTACTEIQKADNTWNDVTQSNFDLGYTTASITDIHVKGDDPADDGLLALATQALSGGTLVGADIDWDEDTFCFTDSSLGNADPSCYDIQSVAAHEFGHTQWVDHSFWNWDSIMQDNLSPDTQRRTVEQHDIDVLQARH